MDLNWFQMGPIPDNEITGTYNYGLVTLSYVIAVLASYVALDLAGRLRSETNQRIQMYWLLGGAFAMGAGIWAMHFIGMLSFVMPMPMGYELTWTISSLFVAILASVLALFMLKNKDRPMFYMIIGGILIGLGIAAMHYMGMQAMTSYVTIHYLPGIFFLSILIAITAAEAALWFALQSSRGSLNRQFFLKIVSALVMGAAICGMHYTGMIAAIFTPLPHMNAMHAGLINPYLLAILIAAITALIIILALTISIYYRIMGTAIQKEKRFLNTMLNNLVDGILACDATGNITVCNNALGQYCQVVKNHSYLVLDNYFQFKIPNAERFVSPIEHPLYRTLNGEQIRGQEYLMCFPNQDDKDVIIDGQPIIDAEGKELGAVIIIHDITYLKQTEQVKQEFISVVSHELRTPLTSILGALSLLLGKIAGDVPEKMQNLLEIAKNNTERLIRLVNDILDIEKIESGKMDFSFKNFDIASLIREAIENMQNIAEIAQVKIIFEHEGEEMVYADYDKLIQVMVNLLSNAIRFSEAGQSVTITLVSSDEETRVSVIDHGQGISEEFRTKIFTKFSQADSSSSRKKGGTGLGLSICKAIIEKHGGKISFESIPNQITSFYFNLTKHLSEAKIMTQTEVSNQPASVLICDSNRDTATTLQHFLLTNDISSDIALTAEKARELLKQKSYEAIAMDLILQDYDGIKFIQELRRNDATATIPIVVISTLLSDEKKVINGCGFPIIDWLQKPLKEKQLMQFLQYLKIKFKTELPHILCVEDDLDNSKVIQELLSEQAIVSPAFTIKSAREKLNAYPYDLVVLDLKLPDGMGTDLLPCMNCKTKNPIPVIVFSAYDLQNKFAPLIRQILLNTHVPNDELLAILCSVLNKKIKKSITDQSTI